MGLLRNVGNILFGKRETEWPCPDSHGHTPYEPRHGEFFDPLPGSWEGPNPTVQARGPARIEVGRLGPRRFRMLRHVGYRDRATGEIWVVPRKIDEWTLDFSSAPVLVNWIIPALGTHFNPFVLHDALVEEKPGIPSPSGQQGSDYFGKKVSREEADRIARDAMYEQGTGFVRRWIAWVGTMVGTIVSKEGIGAPKGRRRYLTLFVLYILTLVVLGIYSCGEVIGAWQNLPWMAGEDWPVRLLFGGIGAIVTPFVLCPVWVTRWRFGLLAGLLLTTLLPALIVTTALTVLYVQAERVFKYLGYTNRNACTLSPLAFGERGPRPEEP